MKHLIILLLLLNACVDNSVEEDKKSSIDTPPIKKMLVSGGYTYVYEDTQAMDFYTDAERAQLNSLFE